MKCLVFVLAEDRLVVICITSSFWIPAANAAVFSPPLKRSNPFIIQFVTLRKRNWLTTLWRAGGGAGGVSTT